jgi:hypothetical protein
VIRRLLRRYAELRQYQLENGGWLWDLGGTGKPEERGLLLQADFDRCSWALPLLVWWHGWDEWLDARLSYEDRRKGVPPWQFRNGLLELHVLCAFFGLTITQQRDKPYVTPAQIACETK